MYARARRVLRRAPIGVHRTRFLIAAARRVPRVRRRAPIGDGSYTLSDEMRGRDGAVWHVPIGTVPVRTTKKSAPLCRRRCAEARRKASTEETPQKAKARGNSPHFRDKGS